MAKPNQKQTGTAPVNPSVPFPFKHVGFAAPAKAESYTDEKTKKTTTTLAHVIVQLSVAGVDTPFVVQGFAVKHIEDRINNSTGVSVVGPTMKRGFMQVISTESAVAKEAFEQWKANILREDFPKWWKENKPGSSAVLRTGSGLMSAEDLGIDLD